MKTYVLEFEGEILVPKIKVNKRGFFDNEVKEIMQKKPELQKYNILCIEDEIEKFHLENENIDSLPEEVLHYKIWYDAYQDNNINGFSLPIKVKKNDEYRKSVEKKFNEYIDYLNRPAFAYEFGLIDIVKKECKMIIEALDKLINKEEQLAENILSKLFMLFDGDTFFISDLDKSYSFRGIAPFLELRSQGNDDIYESMLNKELTFFRVRTKKKEDKETIISDVEHMLHLPYDKRHKASSMRFSVEGKPGLYLGTTTYVCSNECRWNKEDELYSAIFIPNESGKKLKILNLTISQALINGMYNRGIDTGDTALRKYQLQVSMLKIFPIVLATSYDIEDNENIKYQYLLSQMLMKIANKNGIDGIAYLSMQGKDEFQYPQGVNLAFPAYDISEKKQYSDICKGFDISKPIFYEEQNCGKKKSYINEIYKKYDIYGNELYMSKIDYEDNLEYYGDTSFGKFDNYLVEKIIRK